MSRLSAAELRDAADPLVIALACAGDSQAFTELVKRRHQRVRKFMYHLCREPQLGDDLAQQVFLTAWRSLRQLRTAAAFDGWLKRIMVTTWLEELRRRKIAYVKELTPDTDPRVHFDGSAEGIDLDAALAMLPPQVRLCVVLAHSEGMSHTEIAALTKMPLGTVKSHVARGSARLRQLLAAYERA